MPGLCGSGRGFCCSGCRAAYEFITSAGLQYVYALRGEGELPVPYRGTFAHFNDEAFARAYLSTDANGFTVARFHLSGIHCSACVWLLEKLPEAVPGILEVRVDLIRAQARVRFDRAKISAAGIAETFASIGYQPHPLAPGAHGSPIDADRTLALRLGIAGFCAMNVMLLFIGRYQGLFTGMDAGFERFFGWVSLALAIPSVTYCAFPFFAHSWAGIRMRRLSIDLPISIAIAGGFAASACNLLSGRSEIYLDTVTALIFLLLVGRWFQRRAMKRVADVAELLYSLTPLAAVRIHTDGTRETVFAASLVPGDLVAVEPEGQFPCDGVIDHGSSFVNNALLTGESKPVAVQRGDPVWSGAKNIEAAVVVRASACGDGTRLGWMVCEIGFETERRSRIATFADRASGYFVAAILALAALVAASGFIIGFAAAFDRVIALLVVSCPCALGIATPVMLHLASARAAKRGILLQDGDALERMAGIEHICFDKTGTLTTGELTLQDVVQFDTTFSRRELWAAVGALEAHSETPAGRALRAAAAEHQFPGASIPEVCTEPGRGVYGRDADGVLYRLGSLRWLRPETAPELIHPRIMELLERGFSVAGFERNGELAAVFALGDTVRPEAATVVKALRARGIGSSILSGDLSSVVQSTAAAVGIPGYVARGELTPEEKAALAGAGDLTTAMVGDGVNDASALAAAGVGIGIRGGAEMCLRVSDLYLLRPDLTLIVEAIDGARAALRTIHRHLAISLVYNIAAAALAVSGLIGPLAAALIMPLSSLTVILSSLYRAPFGGESR